jgi:hypothetical protein
LLTLFRAISSGRPKIVVGAYGIVGDTDYGIKVEFETLRFNIQGQNTLLSLLGENPEGAVDQCTN